MSALLDTAQPTALPHLAPVDPPLSTALSGWFCVGLAADLRPGTLRPLTFFGREYVLMRTASGTASMLDAHCPHLGAHLGHGGRVDGERLVCPFHGFAFDTAGRCVGTSYEGPLPARSNLNTTPLVERGGLLLTWHHPRSAPPSWELPAWDERGFSALRGVHSHLATHPQETSENSVDLGHFSYVHGYRNVRISEPLDVAGPRLSITYSMLRNVPGTPVAMPVRFHVDVWGLGLSIVTFGVVGMPFEARLFILACPSEEGHVELRAATQVRVQGGALANRLGPWVRDVANRFVLHSVRHDVEQDRAMWEHKRYMQRPQVAQGDGPIGRYRHYVRQFYPIP